MASVTSQHRDNARGLAKLRGGTPAGKGESMSAFRERIENVLHELGRVISPGADGYDVTSELLPHGRVFTVTSYDADCIDGQGSIGSTVLAKVVIDPELLDE